MRARATAIAFVAILQSGCGLVFQGTSQTIHLRTQPDGAAIRFGPITAISPAAITRSRRAHHPVIFRAEKVGYRPACKVNDCGAPRWIKVLDSIPAAIPLLIDLAAGSLANCDDDTLTLEPIRAGDATFSLPDLAAMQPGDVAAVCAFPYLFDNGFAAQAARIIVSTGSIQQAHELIGNVDFGKLGFDRVDAGSIWWSGIVWGRIRRTFAKATPGEVNELLRKRALYLYGERVDALINVNYQSDPANNVFATAVAVHFTDGAPQSGSASTRLGELEKLHKSGLIDQREYEQKRAEILRGL